MNADIRAALDKLSAAPASPDRPAARDDREWPGLPEEDIAVCVHKGNSVSGALRRQDFFFLNYAYKGSYDAISCLHGDCISVREGECCIGRPGTGCALNRSSDRELIIISVLIKKESFYRTLLPLLSSDAALFGFFLDPGTNRSPDGFLHIKFGRCSPARPLLEMMVQEYACQKEDTQAILKPLAMALLMHVARRYRGGMAGDAPGRLSDRILRYMRGHTDAVTLRDIAAHFSYHPNYISGLLHRELGKTFSQLLLELRMERAVMLMRAPGLTIEEVAYMLGYSNSSNFYKAFREYYRCSPREYMENGRP